MDTIKDFFGELKNRAGNPLISSFIISWLIFNWKVPVALLFYKHDEVIFDGYLSYFDLITKNTIWYNSIIFPLIASVVYTAYFPKVKALIKLRIASIEAENETDILSATKDGRIPIEKYIAIKTAYQLKVQQYTDTLEEEVLFVKENTKLLDENNKLSDNNRQLSRTVSDFKEEYQIIESYNDKKILHGIWDVTDLNIEDGKQINKVWTNNKTGLNVSTLPLTKSKISHFVCNYYTKEVSFSVFTPKAAGTEIDYYFLNIEELPLEKLSGTVNHKREITLIRKGPDPGVRISNI